MGCDIHAHIEVKEYDDWWELVRLNLRRNYDAFGLMAGVRGWDSLHPPKGMPSDYSFSVLNAYGLYVTDESEGEGYASKVSAERWVELGISKYIREGWISHPDHHTPSWLTVDEFEQVCQRLGTGEYHYHTALAMMKAIPHECRIVFWFDN